MMTSAVWLLLLLLCIVVVVVVVVVVCYWGWLVEGADGSGSKKWDLFLQGARNFWAQVIFFTYVLMFADYDM